MMNILRYWMVISSTVVLIFPVGALGSSSSLKTRWTDQVSTNIPLSEYPRPQMKRGQWMNLNGEWDYAITSLVDNSPTLWTGKILVPFPVESTLSGVTHRLTKDEYLWYRRSFVKPSLPKDERLLLHFGAVDWCAVIYVNGKLVAEHKGGYTPFTLDITDALTSGAVQELKVRVWDPTGNGFQPRGKQSAFSTREFYTQVSGIWQTVWLEVVPTTWIDQVVIVPNAALDGVSVMVTAGGKAGAKTVKAILRDGDQDVATIDGKVGEKLLLPVKEPKLWSPDHPFLYNISITLAADRVDCYTGLRRIEVRKDDTGINRLFLNGKALFECGVLDQGYWPDGLYTAPTDEALKFDVQTAKAVGFNLIRKHEKIEAARWYYWCDQLGMLVWQDIPDGHNDGPDGPANFVRETKEMIGTTRNFPSIILWDLFNFASCKKNLGPTKSEELVNWIKNNDPTRLIDVVNREATLQADPLSEVSDCYSYPWPAMNPLEQDKACVVGEFGGMDIAYPAHIWRQSVAENEGINQHRGGAYYLQMFHVLNLLRSQGLAGSVYVQLTDVERELNGIMTYDREVNKFDTNFLTEINRQLCAPLPSVKVLAGGDLSWQFSTNSPGNTNSFNDSQSWDSVIGPFGHDVSGRGLHTLWTSEDLQLCREFQNLDDGDKVYVLVWSRGGIAVQVGINGTVLPELSLKNGQVFRFEEITERTVLKSGINLISVTAQQSAPMNAAVGLEVRLLSVKNDPFVDIKKTFSKTSFKKEAQGKL